MDYILGFVVCDDWILTGFYRPTVIGVENEIDLSFVGYWWGGGGSHASKKPHLS